MIKFWNVATIILVILTICILSYTLINFSSLEISNKITLIVLSITILSTLYSNYKSDERVNQQIKTSEEQFEKQLAQNERNLKEQLLFNKKQEIYIRLYKDLNEYWEFLDDERINYYLNNYPSYEPNTYLTVIEFSDIHKIIINFNLSADFLYMPQEIQETVKKFLRHVENNLEHYDYYNYTTSEFQSALNVLSEIFPLLKREIGLKNYHIPNYYKTSDESKH